MIVGLASWSRIKNNTLAQGYVVGTKYFGDILPISAEEVRKVIWGLIKFVHVHDWDFTQPYLNQHVRSHVAPKTANGIC
eukprot:scaffold1383_cov68-Cylindrotheca_fusiformis.AAC.3